jgi:hypothetical protein
MVVKARDTYCIVYAGGLRVSTTVYAHRAVRSLLVFEVSADFGTSATTRGASDSDETEASVTVRLERCGGKPIDWSELVDFNASSSSSSSPPSSSGVDGSSSPVTRSLVVKHMEENCDSGHYCPLGVALEHCGGLGRCNETTLPTRPHTEVGLAFEQLPATLTLTASKPTRVFVAAIHTSLELGLGAPGAAEAAAAATLAKYSASSSGGNGELRQRPEAAWAEEGEGGIEVSTTTE